ncbi:hypothetical protein R7X40_03590, partial [Mesomycoplasma ovipneumoniae]|nr:hypothetical protein [Mesomycoplasma ovipneumoniae]
KNRKEINELDSAVIKLQSLFRETSLDSDSYSKLTFPKKVEGAQNQGKKAEGAQNQGKKVEGAQNQGKKSEGTPNQGKKAEGAQNQGKKAEGAQNQGKKVETDTNSLTSYLSELGKKVDEYLETHFKDKNYKTLVESISDSFGKTTKDLFFVLVKDDSTSDSGSSGTSSTTPQKRSSLKVRITISKTENTASTSGTVSSS